MADLSQVIQQGNAQQAEQGSRLSRQGVMHQQVSSSQANTAMQQKVLENQMQENIDMKGGALMSVLGHAHSKSSKAKSVMDDNIPKGFSKYPHDDPTRSIVESSEVSREDWFQMEKRSFLARGGDADAMSTYEKYHRQYLTELDSRAELLDSMSSDPRVLGIMSKYTLSDEDKRAGWMPADVIDNMTPTQRDRYVGRLTAAARAEEQMRIDREDQERGKELEASLELEDARSGNRLMAAQGKAEYEQQMVKNKNSIQNQGRAFVDMLPTLVGSKSSDLMKEILGGEKDIVSAVGREYDANPEKAMASAEYLQNIVDSIGSQEFQSPDDVVNFLTGAYEQGLQGDSQLFTDGNPFGGILKSIILSAQTDAKDKFWGKNRQFSVEEFQTRIGLKKPETKKLKSRIQTPGG